MWTSIVGYTAGTMVAMLQFPQVWEVYHHQSTVSKSSLAVHSVNGILWLVYGSLLNAYPILMANSVYVASNLVLLYFHLYRTPPVSVPRTVSTQTDFDP